jgi:hypothetical protein
MNDDLIVEPLLPGELPPLPDVQADSLEPLPGMDDFIGEDMANQDIGLFDDYMARMPREIKTQEEYDSLPQWMKDAIIMQSNGVPLSETDFVNLAMEGIKQERATARQPRVVEVDGMRLLDQGNGSFTPLRDPSTRQRQVVNDQGIVMLIDDETGIARPVVDQQGNPIRSQERAPGAANMAMEQMNQQAIMQKVMDLQKVNAEIAKHGEDASSGGFLGMGGTKLTDKRNALLMEIEMMETGKVPSSGNLQTAPEHPAATPSPAPTPQPQPSATPSPMPTPQAQPSVTPSPMPTPQAQPSVTPAPAGIAEGTIARNPQTGERIIFSNGSWQPLQ